MSRKPNYVKKDLITPELTSLINSLKRGTRVIQGHLLVAPDHSYWWFLEYGTGAFHEAPDGELQEPSGVSSMSAEGGPYEITIKDAKLLVYMTGGHYVRQETTEHPGIKPHGFVRTSIHDTLKDFGKELNNVARRKRTGWRGLPTRDELVELVNETLLFLLRRLEIRTPDNSDPDPYHEGRNPIPLSEAWRIQKAK